MRVCKCASKIWCFVFSFEFTLSFASDAALINYTDKEYYLYFADDSTVISKWVYNTQDKQEDRKAASHKSHSSYKYHSSSSGSSFPTNY